MLKYLIITEKKKKDQGSKDISFFQKSLDISQINVTHEYSQIAISLKLVSKG